MKTVTVENVKNIEYLKFNLPEKRGVYLLAGPNGVGKTTLLVCLDRICNHLAFARNFITSPYNDQVDRYDKSAISYHVDDPKLDFTFHKRNKRWTTTPRIDSAELTKFGYKETVFIQANSKRIDVKVDDIRRGIFENVSDTIKGELNTIFETEKFNNLKRLKNSMGRGKNPHYFYVIAEGKIKYSEKRFSTGELALLRLVERLSTVNDGALILLDEAEMALHPRVQQNLLKYLKEKTEQKNLTVIISTHSVTMIKSVDKEHILLLEKEDDSNRYIVMTPCYAAKAIGCVDYIQNARYDVVFFVEDEMAKLLLRKMIVKCIKNDEKYSTIESSIFPVGGYRETYKLALSTKERLFHDAKVFAVLDEDAFDSEIVNADIIKCFEDNKDVIFNLGCTPEVWIIKALEERMVDKEIRDDFKIEVITIINSNEYKACNGDNYRKIAKKKLEIVIEKLVAFSGESKEVSLEKLLDILIEKVYKETDIKKIIMPMLGKIR